MVISRTAVALGFVLVGVGLLVGPTLGQQDATVQRTNSQSAASAVPSSAVIGTIDLGVVMKGYDKAKVLEQEFEAAAMAKSNELLKIKNDWQQEMEMLEKVTPGSAEFKKRQDRISQLKAQLEAGREQAQRDFSLREAEMTSTLYKEVQDMVTRVARQRKMNLVLKISNEPVTASNPNTVLAAIQKSVLYADPQNDITRTVTYWLNEEYKAAGGTAPKATAAPAGGTPSNNRK